MPEENGMLLHGFRTSMQERAVEEQYQDWWIQFHNTPKNQPKM